MTIPTPQFNEEWLKGYERGFNDAKLKFQIELSALITKINEHDALSWTTSTEELKGGG